ncbi:Mediator of RNA polymerase II transcription subunit 20 [Porphyridium purpureum]|uniref:Mediator of RNA polymerase II transcription subunit 20 n=1 Tax=Porphyridium purpureum TaxID=35688 RepID=A0A5J4YSJ3_PORPP|nr:Mediator of RNA polymerase II transcription subunit 20 [Porphyridium purpureum]|eukprot:POR3039..scf229_5
MGATMLLFVPTREHSAALVEKELRRRVEALSGVRADTWKVSCDTCVQPTADARGIHLPCKLGAAGSELHILSFRMRSLKLEYVVLKADDGGPARDATGITQSTELILLPSSPDLRALLMRVAAAATGSKPVRVLHGVQYDMCDLIIRVGTVMERGLTKLTVLEVEYLPCDEMAECRELLVEFLQRVFAPLVASPDAEDEKQACRLANLDMRPHIIELDNAQQTLVSRADDHETLHNSHPAHAHMQSARERCLKYFLLLARPLEQLASFPELFPSR